MLPLPLLIVAAAVVVSDAATPPTRTVELAAYTKKLVPLADLKAEEVELREDGRPRKVLGLELDQRPLDVAIVVDSSGGIAASYRSEIVPAVIAFWKALPAASNVAVWTTAPARVADFGSEISAADTKLRTMAAAGGNYGVDAMTDACAALGAREAPRRVLVYAGGANLQSNPSNAAALMRAVAAARALPVVVLVLPGGRDGGIGGMSGNAVHGVDTQGLLRHMAKGYYGSFAESLTPLAVGQWLKQAAADLGGQYRVHFESEPGPGGALKVDIKRKDARLRVGRCVEDIAGAN